MEIAQIFYETHMEISFWSFALQFIEFQWNFRGKSMKFSWKFQSGAK